MFWFALRYLSGRFLCFANLILSITLTNHKLMRMVIERPFSWALAVPSTPFIEPMRDACGLNYLHNGATLGPVRAIYVVIDNRSSISLISVVLVAVPNLL